ncbi:hypothetical protein KC19_5G056700 [Ceratodon purpureus]|uniref:Uncharacterized protein n=1 Tax=Ceratodon purpureus TaxID=3225 RepID=A0A8T0HYA7_CERPU|nr:hypothetical protein KC19_5G056700 [Ceratodon purpureus]
MFCSLLLSLPFFVSFFYLFFCYFPFVFWAFICVCFFFPLSFCLFFISSFLLPFFFSMSFWISGVFREAVPKYEAAVVDNDFVDHTAKNRNMARRQRSVLLA